VDCLASEKVPVLGPHLAQIANRCRDSDAPALSGTFWIESRSSTGTSGALSNLVLTPQAVRL
jgi:hypothetical protein